jgi:hypothetical protein
MRLIYCFFHLHRQKYADHEYQYGNEKGDAGDNEFSAARSLDQKDEINNFLTGGHVRELQI